MVFLKVCRNSGSLLNRSTKFCTPTNLGAEMPFQLVSDAPIETRIGKNWKATTPTTTGLMNSQPTRFCRLLSRRASSTAADRRTRRLLSTVTDPICTPPHLQGWGSALQGRFDLRLDLLQHLADRLLAVVGVVERRPVQLAGAEGVLGLVGGGEVLGRLTEQPDVLGRL